MSQNPPVKEAKKLTTLQTGAESK